MIPVVSFCFLFKDSDFFGSSNEAIVFLSLILSFRVDGGSKDIGWMLRVWHFEGSDQVVGIFAFHDRK